MVEETRSGGLTREECELVEHGRGLAEHLLGGQECWRSISGAFNALIRYHNIYSRTILATTLEAAMPERKTAPNPGEIVAVMTPPGQLQGTPDDDPEFRNVLDTVWCAAADKPLPWEVWSDYWTCWASEVKGPVEASVALQHERQNEVILRFKDHVWARYKERLMELGALSGQLRLVTAPGWLRFTQLAGPRDTILIFFDAAFCLLNAAEFMNHGLNVTPLGKPFFETREGKKVLEDRTRGHSRRVGG